MLAQWLAVPTQKRSYPSRVRAERGGALAECLAMLLALLSALLSAMLSAMVRQCLGNGAGPLFCTAHACNSPIHSCSSPLRATLPRRSISPDLSQLYPPMHTHHHCSQVTALIRMTIFLDANYASVFGPIRIYSAEREIRLSGRPAPRRKLVPAVLSAQPMHARALKASVRHACR